MIKQGSGSAGRNAGTAPSAGTRGPAPKRAANGGGRRPPGSPTGRPVARGRSPRRRSGRQRVVIAIGCVLTLLTLGVAGAFAWGTAQLNNIDRVDVNLHAAGLDQPQNFLIVGSDTRDLTKGGSDAGGIFGQDAPAGQRSDTLMVARLDSNSGAVELLSIPRDLWVEKADKDHQRINAAYNDGPQSLIDSVERNLGIPINHFVELNFDGFKGVVDVIGGVPMYFDKPLRDGNTGLNITTTGCQVLDPTQALAYARSRYLEYNNGKRWVSDPTGDLGRISRQQVFIRRAMAKVSTLGIGDINTLRRLVGVGVDAVKIDSALSTQDMIDLARKFSGFSSQQLVTHRLPTTDHKTDGGAEVELLDTAAAEPMLQIFRGNTAMVAPETTTTTIVAANVTVDVINGTNTKGLARTDAAVLATHGFLIGEVGNTATTGTTVIRFGPSMQGSAELVAGTMTPAPKLEPDPNLVTGHVQLIIGVDAGTVATGSAVPATTKPATKGSTKSGTPKPPVTTTPTPSTTAPGDTVGEPAAVGFAPGDPPPGVVCG